MSSQKMKDKDNVYMDSEIQDCHIDIGTENVRER